MSTDSTLDLRLLRERSIEIITRHQHASGAYPASPTYPVYKYSWLRDGAFIADSMSRSAEEASATAFFHWCRQVMEARIDRVHELIRRHEAGETVTDSELLPTRYTLDGRDSAADWWDFQLDGYGTWLWALAEHVERHGIDREPFRAAVETTVLYLATFGDRPCYDWWEESHNEQHLSTIGSVIGGLHGARRFDLDPQVSATLDNALDEMDELIVSGISSQGHLGKWVGSDAVDGSLLSCFVPFAVRAPGSDLAEATYRRVVEDLAPGGVYRYLGDTFYGGGQWLNLTAWLGWYEAVTGRLELATGRREWVAAQATDIGMLPEQVSTRVQVPERTDEWVRRWGPIATPLLWSHAMFLTLDSVIAEIGTDS